MTPKKKLQVFVSSTYVDLKEERQAAVEAILAVGHIPAGMELFAAGDESQMNAIRRWIDESDIYMLILGGRYGSIEPKTQNSYIQLEYEYALEIGKPVFAIVIHDDYMDEWTRKNGLIAVEREHPDKLKKFRELVCTKLVRFWRDSKDIKIAIMETMTEFSGRPNLIGWIPGDEVTKINPAVAEELARLTRDNALLVKDNAYLREQLEIALSNILTTIRPEVVDIFLQDIYKTYTSLGGVGYIPLDSMKLALSDQYRNSFDKLLLLAKEQYPKKILIENKGTSPNNLDITKPFIKIVLEERRSQS